MINKPTETFINGRRFYLIGGGKKYPSVTSVIGAILAKPPAVQQWAIKQTVQFLKSKGEVSDATCAEAVKHSQVFLGELAKEGTVNHGVVGAYLKTGKRIESPLLDTFIDWERKEDFKVKYIEQFVYSDKLQVAGSIDLLGTCFGQPFLIDLKTSKGIYSSHIIQACAYKLLAIDNFKSFPRDCKVAILRIDKRGKSMDFYVVGEREEEIYSRIFRGIVQLFYDLNSVGGV